MTGSAQRPEKPESGNGCVSRMLSLQLQKSPTPDFEEKCGNSPDISEGISQLRIETAEEVCNDLVTAAKYIPKDQLGATDDCGFSPFSIDVKPRHGSPDFARDIAFQKITNRLKGAEMASQKLGLAAAA